MIAANKKAQIAAAITARQADVNAKRAALVAAGLNYGGNVYQIDAAALAAMADPTPGFWRSSANATVPMTATEQAAFIWAAKTYAKALQGAAWTLKDEIGKLTTLAAIAAFDITQGWPPNNQ
jgi:hypothetical protein